MSLFWEFFKIGMLTIGGGAAMIPQMQQTAVKDKGWLTDDEMLDCIALGQSLPGVIAVNMATFIGYRKRSIVFIRYFYFAFGKKGAYSHRLYRQHKL